MYAPFYHYLLTPTENLLEKTCTDACSQLDNRRSADHYNMKLIGAVVQCPCFDRPIGTYQA